MYKRTTASRQRVRMASRRWRHGARRLQRDVLAIYLAGRDPRVPWHAKALALFVAGYALSPIDLIPDFIPIIGYLDDLILLPLGLLLVIRLIPAGVMNDLRAQAEHRLSSRQPRSLAAAGVIVSLWLAGAMLTVRLLAQWLSS